jgi:hypothetical protein
MRLQLTRHARGAMGWGVMASLTCALCAAAMPSPAFADASVKAASTVFSESGGPLFITVVNPSVSAAVDLGSSVAVNAQYSADIVSGASVAIVDAPTTEPDVITSATRLNDLRHVVGGGVELRSEQTSLNFGYAYGTERDYRSQSFTVSGSTALFSKNTLLALSYGLGKDEVCDLNQPGNTAAVERLRMPSSDGCFSSPDRISRPVDLQTVQATLTQSWTPIFTTQLVGSGQLIDGFQSNPYRSVWLGRSAAQENHPFQRNRFSVGLNARVWVDPLNSALHFYGRGYRDTWDIRSITAEAAYEQHLSDFTRIRGRVRYYQQTAAAFFSDDYALEPMGQYFTGDRELSSMGSTTLGGLVTYQVPPSDDGDVWGFLQSVNLQLKADFLFFRFPDFNYGSVAVPNDKAFVLSAGLETFF